ncbi:hypothetical protein J6590_071685 [Homalodisca vitripennis]|nr:hypothetical protein J6590_071685 [Homalodisca vitripennis]
MWQRYPSRLSLTLCLLLLIDKAPHRGGSGKCSNQSRQVFVKERRRFPHDEWLRLRYWLELEQIKAAEVETVPLPRAQCSNGYNGSSNQAWLLLRWMTAEQSCTYKQPACSAIGGGGSEVTFEPLVSRLSVREGFLSLTSPAYGRGHQNPAPSGIFLKKKLMSMESNVKN